MLFVLMRPAAARPEEKARERLHLNLGTVAVSHYPGDADLARQAAAAVQYASERIAEDLGISLDRPVPLAIVRGREEFDRLCGRQMPRWALAAALRGRRGIVVDAARVTPATASDVRLTVFHEVVHLALFQVEADRPTPLPLWFHEGVATRMSSYQHLLTDTRAFNIAAMHGRLIPFDDLEHHFPAEPAEASLAYLQSESFIGYIARSRSLQALRGILGRYRRGESFETAFQSALGLSRAEMEKRWRRKLRKRFPWLRTIWEMTTLCTVMALATVAVFLLVRRRSRRQRQRWQAEETIWTVVGDEREERGDDGLP